MPTFDESPKVTLRLLVGGFTPAHLSGLQLWLDASKISGLADGDPITTWSDLSGNGNDATQATAAKKPLYKVNIINGRPVVRFDGTDDWLSAGDVTFLDGLTGLTCFAVAKVASGNGVVVGKTSASEAFGLYLRSTIPSIFLARTSVSAYCDANAAQTAGTWYVLTCWYDGANLFLRISGDLQTDQPALTGGILASADQFALGAEVASAATSQSHLNGDIAEVLLYTRALSTAERQSVEAYLGAKYGIDVPGRLAGDDRLVAVDNPAQAWVLLSTVSEGKKWDETFRVTAVLSPLSYPDSKIIGLDEVKPNWTWSSEVLMESALDIQADWRWRTSIVDFSVTSPAKDPATKVFTQRTPRGRGVELS